MNLFQDIDRLSFWLGFLAGILFWLLLGRFWPLIVRLFVNLKIQSQSRRQERTLNDEIRLGNDTLRLLQHWHLADPLFSLDEIVIPPRLLAPEVPPMAYEPPPSEDITDWAMPALLRAVDWPELASFYGAPTLGITEALKGDANLALVGQPGSGKTVALAYLAAQIIRKKPEASHLESYVPVLIRAADLVLPSPTPDEALSSLLPALTTYVTSIPGKRLPGFLHKVFKQGRALLLLDGLDEFSPTMLQDIVGYLDNLFQQYPGLRVVVTADPANLGGLPALGLQRLALTSWNQAQRALFISRWSDLWDRYVANRSRTTQVDALLVIGWLLNNTVHLTPLELTLKVWAAFAGDALGPATLAAIEAYLRRMTADQPRKNRLALEQLAAQMVLNLQPVASRGEVENWLGGFEMVSAGDTAPPVEPEQVEDSRHGKRPERVRARGALPDLIDSGLLTLHTGDRISIAHPLLAGYLAAQTLAPVRGGHQIITQPDWNGKFTTLNFLAILESPAAWVNDLMQDENMDILQRGLLMLGRLLRHAPDGLPWTSNVMRRLAAILQKERLPASLKGRALSALIISGNPGVVVLLRQMLTAPYDDQRHYAALGLGALRDIKSVSELIDLVRDRSPEVSRAAMLALVAIGEKTGMEAVASLLLTGDESQRRGAAEALANDPEEGHPTLEEGSSLDDPAVRRAAIFGLGRSHQPWAINIVDKLRTEDSHWVVQDAANQVMNAIEELNPRLPRQLPQLTQMGWLVAFAAERGMGIAPGKPAFEMLNKALREGSDDQRLAALYYLKEAGDEGAIMPLYQVYFTSQGDVHELAFEALWNLAARGIEIPPPIQYGLV